jgi:hypothetical protein
MKKTIIITLCLLLLITGTAKATLYEYYNGILPSIKDRINIAESCNIQGYRGTYDQNIKLEECLRNNRDFTPELGAALASSDLTQIVADFRSSLAQKLSVGGTTMTLQRVTDDDGVTLASGKYSFTLDGSSSNKEYVICDLNPSTKACSNLINISRQGVRTSGAVREHRVGSAVTITDYTSLKYHNDILEGVSSTTGGLLLGNGKISGLYDLNGTFTWIKYNTSTSEIQWSNNGSDYYNFTSSSITQLTASSTAGIGVTDSKIYLKASSTLGGAFDASGNYYQKVSSTQGLQTDSNGIGINYAHNNTWTGTNTFNGTTSLGTMSATNGSINNLDITFNGTSFTKLTQGQALSIGDGTSVAINRDINTTANIVKKTQIGDTQWVAWIFTTPDTGVTSTITTTTLKFNLTHSGSVASDNITLSIRSISDGSPTGSDLTSTTISGDVWGVTQGDRIFTANFNYGLTPNTQYALVVRLATSGNGIKSFYGNYLSTNSGSTWSAITGLDSAPSSDIRYNATTTAGKLFPSSAYSSNSGLKFVGFAGESVNNDSLISVITGFPVYYGASGLTSGSYYYLSDYPGVVSSTAGSVTKRIGIAVSSTALKIDIID